MDIETITVRSNPGAVLRIPDPACQYDEDDPDSPDCTCGMLVNPAPDPLLDQVHIAGYEWTLLPCGHTFAGSPRVCAQHRAKPGTLGALMEDWAGMDPAALP
jgi:hypothetical protein